MAENAEPTGAGACLMVRVSSALTARDNDQATGNDTIADIREREKQIVEAILVGNAASSEYYSVYFSKDCYGFWWIPQGQLP
jgi:hypothetical protein